jgi:hypothetical protein
MGEYNSYTGTYTDDQGAEVTMTSAGTTATSAPTSATFQADTGFEVQGDIMSTAKSPTGSAVVGREVRPSDTIQTHGHRMTVAMAIQLGFLSQDAGGNFTPTSAGQAGAAPKENPKGTLELASGGTAEEALEAGFMTSAETEEALSTIIATTNADTRIAALDSLLRNGGEVDAKIVNRMAMQAGVPDELMAEAVEAARDGVEAAVLQRLAPLGVYDADTFSHFIFSDPRMHQRFVESTRDLMMSNSTKGFEGLAEEFAMSADKVDPASVEGALHEAGIKFSRMGGGGVLLDLTAQGLGQMTFKQAVSLGYIKLSRNT